LVRICAVDEGANATAWLVPALNPGIQRYNGTWPHEFGSCRMETGYLAG